MLALLNPFWKYICAVLSASTLVLGAVVRIQSGQIHRWHVQNDKNVAARLAGQARYAQAQKDAAAQNKAHVAAVEAQQQRISDERLKDANDRLARLSDELRAHGPAAQGHAGAAGSPPASKPATGTDGPASLCLSSEQLLRAAQDEERHDQLITWIEQQLTIDPNK